ncbi:heptaprenyl diphosphate synthase component 1 [Neobacillus cucumis]|uniref:heptaprenyl diphosphate synthase component 1 n=1 Tax=Neobacillus cucumis TaxID=1740721 RepID=UPI0021553B6D|nr:heptaprenyl diphosphate synthase component 1 [Neobacillus cucumis]
MKVQDVRQKFNNIKEQVEKRVFNSYLLEYIETPNIDEDKLLILVSILESLDLSFEKIKTYTLSTMLIQIALDTHEYISGAVVDEKKRQLTVLAGDYFSGLYYKLLAESEDINMIKSLSKGVKEVNENKILVYQSDLDRVDSLMTSIIRIESSLLTKVSDYFKVEFWNEFLANLLLFKRLINERNEYFQSGCSIFFQSLQKIFFSEVKLEDLTEPQQQQLLKVCDDYLERLKQAVEKALITLPNLNDFLVKRVKLLLSQYQPYAKTFVEEG